MLDHAQIATARDHARAHRLFLFGPSSYRPLVPTIEMTNPAALPADWRDIFALTKPRVMSLVVFTGLCGLLAAPVAVPPVLGFTAILCIALAAGWLLLLAVFMWLHVPEPTIAEILRAVESRR